MKDAVPGYGNFRLGMGPGALKAAIGQIDDAVDAREAPGGDILLKLHDRTVEFLFHGGLSLYQIIVRIQSLPDDRYARLIDQLKTKYGETTGLRESNIKRPRLTWILGRGRYEIDCFPSSGGCTIHYTDMLSYKRIHARE